uniref:Uncharacterized protein n=1 Tax=Rhizophora mucronata TaxID=61149 RepID=A0A2P2PKR3_RHIMU
MAITVLFMQCHIANHFSGK